MSVGEYGCVSQSLLPLVRLEDCYGNIPVGGGAVDRKQNSTNFAKRKLQKVLTGVNLVLHKILAYEIF